MANDDRKHDESAGPQQSQGGIGHQAASAAQQRSHPAAGSPQGAVNVPGPSLDSGGGDDPHDGRAHSGFTGDDGQHVATDSTGSPGSLQPGHDGDLGAEQDERHRGVEAERAERREGTDVPYGERRGDAAADGAKDASVRIPGEDLDKDQNRNG